jgi:hypothetical protein
MAKKQADNEDVFIQGPSGDVIQIGRADFEKSHYAEQGYEIGEPVPEGDPDAPKDVPADGFPTEGK